MRSFTQSTKGNWITKSVKTPFFQPKLTIGSSNDVYEKEADAMADKVMRMEQDGEGMVQAKSQPISQIQRMCACEDEEHVQRKESEQSQAPAIVSNVVSSGGGKSLDGTTQSFMEGRFGYDFSSVKIHDDTIAAKSAQSINASAYTSGNNIVFNQGQYAPDTNTGRKLLVHELTHVVQQNGNLGAQIQKQDSLQATPNQSGNLQVGNVIRVEVRSGSGGVEPMTHNYPVSPNGCVNLPMVGCIIATGKTTTQLRSDINTALMGGFYTSPTVNVSMGNQTINYRHRAAPGESIFIRVLITDGSVEFEGMFPVDSNGQIHIPMVGDLTVQGQGFSTTETVIKNALISGQFLVSPTVHVAERAI